MSSKRKVPALGLERRVKARREEDWNPELEDSDSSSSDGDVSEEGVAQGADEELSDSAAESASGSESESEAPEPAQTKVDLSSVSFGALARAQASLPPSEKKSKVSKSTDTIAEDASREKSQKKHTSRGEPKPKRSSKHAPQEQSAKRPVSRRREILPDTRRQARDPRFDPTLGKVDEAKEKRAYAFLDEYRDKEMVDLRIQIKKTKDPHTKEDLKRQLLSMESKKKATKKKDEADRLLQEHRMKEKELVAQGKTPFYLKKSEQKKQLLVNQYADMSKGQVDRAIERKRKKISGKEKKELDFLQRARTR